MQSLRSALWTAILIAPTLAVVVWATHPAITAIYAAWTFPDQTLDPDAVTDTGQQTRLKREIQQHFREYQVYVPLEDMLFRDSIPPNNSKLRQGLVKLCGRGIILVWVPLQVKIPFWGDQIFEWCWKPDIQRVAVR
jgi:hypothetical protein